MTGSQANMANMANGVRVTFVLGPFLVRMTSSVVPNGPEN